MSKEGGHSFDGERPNSGDLVSRSHSRIRILHAAQVLTPLEVISPGVVIVRDGTIIAVGPDATLDPYLQADIIDCGAGTLVPGFVDLHIHGSGGYSVMEGAEAVRQIARFLTQFGVTAWLPTMTPRPSLEEMAAAMRDALPSIGPANAGAEAVGFHLEGPFLNPQRPGAIRREWFRPPSQEDVVALLAAAENNVRMMTLAPELPGGFDVVRYLAQEGVVASIGHSDATYDDVATFVAAGGRHATHMYNAMRGFQHRTPGLVGAVLTSDGLTAEVIADGVHVHPAAIDLLVRAKGVYRVAVITDAVSAAGLGDGAYEFDGRPITVRAGKATLADGTIAGSVATFDANVRRLVQQQQVSLQQAAIMSSTVPARRIGLWGRKGLLAAGYDADLVLLDADLQVRFTMARGQIVYDSESESGV